MNKHKIAQELTKVAKLLLSLDRWQRIELRHRQNERYLRSEAKRYTLTFRNKAMKDLWDEELTGQISDGMWENTAGTGWEFWSGVKTSVGGRTSFGPGKAPYGVKTGFGFTKLIDYVGDRMLETIQETEPDATEKTLRAYLQEINTAMRKGEAPAKGGTGAALGKDIKRIEDIVNKKYPGNPEAQLKAAERMAKSIKDIEKAIRRGKAAEQLGYPELAAPFFAKAKALA